MSKGRREDAGRRARTQARAREMAGSGRRARAFAARQRWNVQTCTHVARDVNHRDHRRRLPDRAGQGEIG